MFVFIIVIYFKMLFVILKMNLKSYSYEMSD